jgi:hypothetical protein
MIGPLGRKFQCLSASPGRCPGLSKRLGLWPVGRLKTSILQIRHGINERQITLHRRGYALIGWSIFVKQRLISAERAECSLSFFKDGLNILHE